MRALDETILFSAIAILLAALGLGGLADLASTDAKAASNTRELQVSVPAANGRELHASSDTCTPAAAARPARSGDAQRG